MTPIFVVSLRLQASQNGWTPPINFPLPGRRDSLRPAISVVCSHELNIILYTKGVRVMNTNTTRKLLKESFTVSYKAKK